MERTRVFVMMAGLTALLVVLGQVWQGTEGALVFFAFAAVMNFALYWWSDKMVLRMYRARVVTEAEAREFNLVAAQLAIVNPLAGARGVGLSLFSTHPSTEERVARLEELAASPDFKRLHA